MAKCIRRNNWGYMFVLFACSFSHSMQAQNYRPFILAIKCEIENVNSIYIGEAFFFNDYTASKPVFDSVKGSNGTFIFKGELLYPTAVRIFSTYNGEPFNHLLFVDTGYQEFVLKKISKGTEIYIENPSPVVLEHKKFLIETGLDSIDGDIDLKKFSTYIKENSASYAALYKFLFDVTVKGRVRKLLLEAIDEFDVSIKETKGYKAFVANYLFGLTIPGLKLRDIYDKKTKLTFSNPDGRFTLLEYWYTGCIYCPQSMKEIKKALNDGLYNRLRVISICTDEKGISDEAKELLKKIGITWKNYWDFGATQSGKYIKHLKFDEEQTVYPSNVLLDNKGRVLARDVDPKYLYEFFE